MTGPFLTAPPHRSGSGRQREIFCLAALLPDAVFSFSICPRPATLAPFLLLRSSRAILAFPLEER
jgi:hypothetical protein